MFARDRGVGLKSAVLMLLVTTALPATAWAQEEPTRERTELESPAGDGGGSTAEVTAPSEGGGITEHAVSEDTPPPTPDEGEAGAESAVEQLEELATDEAAAPVQPPEINVVVDEVEAIDSSLDEDAIRAIIAGDVGEYAQELAELEATAIRIPEVRVTFDMPTAEAGTITEEMVYRDIEITDVVDGVAASVTLGGAEITVGSDVTITLDTMTASDFNLGALLGFYGMLGDTGSDEFETVYTSSSFAGGTFVAPDVTCTFGEITTEEFSARPISVSYLEVMGLLQAVEANPDQPPAPQDLAKIIDFYADLFTAFESSPTDFAGFSCDGQDDTGAEVTVSLEDLTIGAFGDGRYPDVTATGFSLQTVGGPEGTEPSSFDLATLTFKGFEVAPVLQTLQAAQGNIDEAWLTANGRALIPPFEGLSFSGFSMDIPQPANEAARLVASVEEFDLTLGNYVNGIPADVSSFASGIVSPLPPDVMGVPMATLIDAGIEELDLDYALEMTWDEASSDYNLSEISVTGAQLGTVAMAATVGNAVAELFSTDPVAQTTAGMGLTLKDFSLDITDEGMADILWQFAATMNGQDVETFKQSMSGMAQGLILASLGGSPEVIQLSNAVGAFINGAGSFHLGLTAKNPAGLGAAEAMMLQAAPQQLLEQVNLEASAE